jgi:hypothetical protein
LAFLGHVQFAFTADHHAGHGDFIALAGRRAGREDDSHKSGGENEEQFFHNIFPFG